MATKESFKVRLCNVQTLGARCGYGEGSTHQEAVDDALRIARETDKDAYFHKQSGEVCFAGGVNC